MKTVSVSGKMTMFGHPRHFPARNGFHTWKKRKLSYDSLASQKGYCLFSFQTFKQMGVSTGTMCQFLFRLQYSYTFLTQYSTINFYENNHE